MSKLKNLEDLFQHEIKDLYSAEKQIIEALPKMEEAASNSQLKSAFREHLKETKKQKERLEKIGEELGFSVKGETCEGIKGLIKEGEEMIDQDAEDSVKDAGLIAAAQRVEHYEMAGYGTARHFAERLNYKDVVNLLEQTLKEEKEADKKLNKIATSQINQEAEVAE